MKFVEVEWLDACMGSGWEGPRELIAPHRCRTRGWLVKEEKDYIVLAHSIGVEDGDEDVGGTIAIRRVDIKRTRRV